MLSLYTYKELYYNLIKDILKILPYYNFLHVIFIEGERYVGKMILRNKALGMKVKVIRLQQKILKLLEQLLRLWDMMLKFPHVFILLMLRE
jgi:hypothetical protein